MKKNLLAFLSALLIVLTVVSCASAPKEFVSDSPLLEGFTESTEFDNSLLSEGSVTVAYMAHAPLNPWKENAVEVAKETGTMRMYFMCASGTSNSGRWGDSCLIAFPNGETMLIDSGESGFGPHLMRNLAALGVERIDYLVFSHCHSDHCYGILGHQEFFTYFEVGRAYWNGAVSSSWSNPNLVPDTMKKYNIPLDILSKGDSFQIGDIKVSVLAPIYENVVGKTFTGDENVNATSIVMRFDYNEVSTLFVGDLYVLEEGKLLKDLGNSGMLDLLDADILKAPHHGGTTSSSVAFVNAVSPTVAVATGSYPMDTSTYGRYAKLGTYIYMDTMDGYIRVVTGGSDDDITVDCSKVRQTKTYDGFDKVAQQIRDSAK